MNDALGFVMFCLVAPFAVVVSLGGGVLLLAVLFTWLTKKDLLPP